MRCKRFFRFKQQKKSMLFEVTPLPAVQIWGDCPPWLFIRIALPVQTTVEKIPNCQTKPRGDNYAAIALNIQLKHLCENNSGGENIFLVPRFWWKVVDPCCPDSLGLLPKHLSRFSFFLARKAFKFVTFSPLTFTDRFLGAGFSGLFSHFGLFSGFLAVLVLFGFISVWFGFDSSLFGLFGLSLSGLFLLVVIYPTIDG